MHFKSRKRKGYALVSILVIGSFAMMFLLGLATTFLSILRSEGVQHQKAVLLDAVDSALDYTVDSLNKNPPTSNSTISEFPVPVSNFPVLNPAISAIVRITPFEKISDWDLKNIKEFSVYNHFPSNHEGESWRLIEITATRGAFQKNVRVILKPQELPPYGADYQPISGTVPSALFPQAVFANTELIFNPQHGQMNVTAKNGLPSLSLKTNNQATLNSFTVIEGDLNAPIVKANVGMPIPEVQGDLNANDPIQGVVNRNGLPILAPDNSAPPPSSVISAPSTNVAEQLQLSATSTTNLASTSYVTDSLQVSSSSSVTLPSFPSGPTKIIIEGAESGLTLDTSGIDYGTTSPDPLNFQVYYDGDQPITITTHPGTTGAFNGVIYAPKSNVTIQGDGTFKGAVLGDKVEFKNKSVEINTDINDTTSSTAGMRNYSYGFIYRNNSDNERVYQGYQAVTWQEVQEKLVP